MGTQDDWHLPQDLHVDTLRWTVTLPRRSEVGNNTSSEREPGLGNAGLAQVGAEEAQVGEWGPL
jgi:hypothetical protein